MSPVSCGRPVRRSRLRLVRAVVGVAIAVSACTGPGLEELTEAADDLAIPQSWALVSEETADFPCDDAVEECPNVRRTYRVPSDVAFGPTAEQVYDLSGFAVWDPAADRCLPLPELGCNVRARRDDIGSTMVVLDVAADSYDVVVEVGQYVGP